MGVYYKKKKNKKTGAFNPKARKKESPRHFNFFSQIFLKHDIAHTRLGGNVYFKRVYSIGLNTVFAYVIPLTSLFYFNLYTVLGKEVSLQLDKLVG